MKTLCRDCVFSVKEGDLQTGCSFDRLNRYKDMGRAEVKEGDSFYTISTFCNFCRDDEWAKDKEDRVSSVLLESLPKHDIVIWVKNHDEAQTKVTLNNLSQKSFWKYINRLYVFLDHTEGDPNHYIDWLNHTFGENIGWTVKRAAPDIFGTKESIMSVTADIFQRSKGEYILILANGATLTENYFDQINHANNIELTPMAWDREDGNHLCMYRVLVPHVAEIELVSDYIPEILKEQDADEAVSNSSNP